MRLLRAAHPREREQAFEAFFDVVFPKAIRAAGRILGDRDAAEDVAVEALARAHLHWSQVEGLAWREAWVLRVAINLALDAARSGRRRSRTLATLASGGSKAVALDAGNDTVVDFAEAVVVREALVEALRRLPQRQRQAVAMRYLGGLSESEVAMALGVSTETVKTHVSRGIGSLRQTVGAGAEEQVFDVD